MRKNRIVLLLFLSGIIFHACQHEKQDIPPESEKNNDMESVLKEITHPEVRKAIEWYGEHGVVDSVSRAMQGRHPLFVDMMPEWAYASVQEGKKHQLAVEVPLRAHSWTVFTLPENAIAYDETKNSIYIQSLTRLVILTNMESGIVQGFFMTLIPSKKYIDARGIDVFRSTYFAREKDFDGYIYFHELDGSFANGWRYTEGKITHRVSETRSDTEHSREKGTFTNCMPVYQATRN